MSKHSVRSGDIAELLNHLARLREKGHARAGASFPIIAVQEAGLDGFWVIACWSGRALRAMSSMPLRF